MTRIELDKAAGEDPADSVSPEDDRLHWHRSLLGKVTSFLLLAVIFAFGVGAAAGWIMVERSSREQWQRHAEMNAQIASSAIRSIYTFVTVDTDPGGQIVRIRTERPLGDEQSILDTGFNPTDVLALASAQTKKDVWLFGFRENEGFVTIADATGTAIGKFLERDGGAMTQPRDMADFFTGFVRIDGEDHFVSSLPVVTTSGEILGAVVASIGRKADLNHTRDTLARNSMLALFLVLLATSALVTIVMRRLFHPVPALIQSLKRIAHNETGTVTPFRSRKDEIGRLAVAIETLREAVVEREHLRQVKETARQMEHLAHHDSLTGLPNRAFLNKSLDTALEAVTSEDARINVMLMDLDRFKAVNDTFGHAIGDGLLAAVSERVTVLLGPQDVAARLGGDEFAIIQRVRRNAAQEARRLAGKIVEAIAAPFEINQNALHIGASVGIACAPDHGETAHVLLTNADIALYASKNAGRGNYSIFESGMAMTSPNRYALEPDLLAAIDREEFELHYQPIVRLANEGIVGYEALLRWRHPELGLIPPDRFIPLAEETGLIVRLGEWVIRRACQDAVSWPRTMTVAVNVSAIQLHRGGLAETIEQALQTSGLDAARLEIEITESLLLSHDRVMPTLTAIRALGVGIALDDFGTGYATFGYLANLPFTRVKLDRSFVAGMIGRSECRTIVGGVISLARGLGMETIAEGVETRQQLELLNAAGCSFAQGYYLGRPAPLTMAGETQSAPDASYSDNLLKGAM